MITQIYATKSHLSQAFVNGKRIPVTVFNVPDHNFISLTNKEKVALFAIGKKNKPKNKPLQGLVQKHKLAFIPKLIKEIPFKGEAPQVNLEKILTKGRSVQVSALTKGKGFSGVIKRHGFSTSPRTHGNKHTRRSPGSIGRGTTPGRVLVGKKMPGRAGFITHTIRNLKIVEFNKAEKILTISGLAPGGKNTLTKIILK